MYNPDADHQHTGTTPPPSTAIMWTASSCQARTGPGGYAVNVYLQDTEDTLRRNGGRRRTTRERMEVFAAIAGLTLLESPHNVELRTMDAILVKTVNDRSLPDHPDLAERLIPLLEKHNTVAILQGRRQDPDHQDAYARALRASRTSPQKPDTGFEEWEQQQKQSQEQPA